ncbi:hypothetical protein TNCV_4059941 [Trichonephila clavipes]|nr:hypothetical protein TNCV_4059941 [Trichonephila clavipes]
MLLNVGQLPVVLIGIHSCLKEDLGANPAELLYGETLRLSGEFFRSTKATRTIPAFVQLFPDTIQTLQPVPDSNHSNYKIFIYKDLAKKRSMILYVGIQFVDRFNNPTMDSKKLYPGPLKFLFGHPWPETNCINWSTQANFPSERQIAS